MKAANPIDERQLRDSLGQLADSRPRLGIDELNRMGIRALAGQPRRGRSQVRRLTILTVAFIGLGTMTAYATLNLGRVSFAEYEQAYIGYADCLRDSGYTVRGPTQFGRDPDAPMALFIGADPTLRLSIAVVNPPQEDQDSGRLDQIWGDCQRQHIGDLETRWLAQAPVIDPQVWIDRVLRCAQGKDVAVPSWLNYQDMLNGVGTDPSDHEIIDIAHQAIMQGCRPWEE